jgi:hypothetical protein
MFSANHFKAMSGSIVDTVETELSVEFPLFKMGLIVGQGVYSKVYSFQIDEQTYIMKIQKLDLGKTEKNRIQDRDDGMCYLSCENSGFSDIQINIDYWSSEIEKMLFLEKHDLSPHIYYYGFYYDKTCKKFYNVIVMENLQMIETLINRSDINSSDMNIVDIVTKVLNVSRCLIKMGVAHCDFKWSNLGYRITDEVISVIPFDFGISKYINQCIPFENEDLIDIDHSRLIGSMCDINMYMDVMRKKIVYDLIRTPTMPECNMDTHKDFIDTCCIFTTRYMKLYYKYDINTI